MSWGHVETCDGMQLSHSAMMFDVLFSGRPPALCFLCRLVHGFMHLGSNARRNSGRSLRHWATKSWRPRGGSEDRHKKMQKFIKNRSKHSKVEGRAPSGQSPLIRDPYSSVTFWTQSYAKSRAAGRAPHSRACSQSSAEENSNLNSFHSRIFLISKRSIFGPCPVAEPKSSATGRGRPLLFDMLHDVLHADVL